ncbi:MAG: STAS domain-containing protein [Candidatus Promineifilaceae bacterium]
MLQVTSKSLESVTLFELNGRFDTHTVNSLRQLLEPATGQPPAQIVVDLTAVNFVDSTALAALVQGMKRSRQQGGDLRLCGLGQGVRIIFELTRLDRAFDIFAKPGAAVQSFQTEKVAQP